jgi:hypothetical protein
MYCDEYSYVLTLYSMPRIHCSIGGCTYHMNPFDACICELHSHALLKFLFSIYKIIQIFYDVPLVVYIGCKLLVNFRVYIRDWAPLQTPPCNCGMELLCCISVLAWIRNTFIFFCMYVHVTPCASCGRWQVCCSSIAFRITQSFDLLWTILHITQSFNLLWTILHITQSFDLLWTILHITQSFDLLWTIPI